WTAIGVVEDKRQAFSRNRAKHRALLSIVGGEQTNQTIGVGAGESRAVPTEVQADDSVGKLFVAGEGVEIGIISGQGLGLAIPAKRIHQPVRFTRGENRGSGNAARQRHALRGDVPYMEIISDAGPGDVTAVGADGDAAHVAEKGL